MKKKTLEEAKARAGWRERYAIEHGTPRKRTTPAGVEYVFTYSLADPYQDANGATYNETRGYWTN